MKGTHTATFATVSDLRDTAAFVKTASENPEPVQVMKGRDRKLVVTSDELLERYERPVAQRSFAARLMEVEAHTRADRIRPMEDVQDDMRT